MDGETALKRLRKIPGGSLPLPHCDSNFTRGYNAANYWASFAQAHLLMSLSPPQHSVFVTATVRQF